MIKNFWEPIKVVASNAGIVLLIAIAGINIKPQALASVTGTILSFVLLVSLYGRLTDVVQNKKSQSYIQLFNLHWLNYLKVQVTLIILPIFILVIFSSSFDYSIQNTALYLGALVNVLAIYICPYIFMNGQGLKAIKKGLRFLFRNLSKSALLIMLSVVPFFLKPIAHLLLTLSGPVNIYKVIGVGVAHNFVWAFINLVVFVVATRVLLESGEKEEFQEIMKTHSESFYKVCSECGLNMPRDFYLKGNDTCIECTSRNAEKQSKS